MNKKEILILVILLVFVISLAAFIFSRTNYSILGIKDVLMMIEDNKEPAITIPMTGEKYFNKWRCFDVRSIEILEAEIDHNGKQIVPYIQVDSNKHSFQFNVDPVIHRGDEKVIINKWKELVNDQRSVCIFATYLQTDPDGTSVCYISKIKTKAGYWDFAN